MLLFDFTFFECSINRSPKVPLRSMLSCPCAGAALHLTAAICILGKSFTSSPEQKIKRCSFVQHLPSLHAALVVLACGLTQARTVALAGLSPCGFVRTRSAGSRLTIQDFV
jgi:hypothetical protein